MVGIATLLLNRPWQALVGDHPVVDRVAQVDDMTRGSRRDGSPLCPSEAVGLLDDLERLQLHAVDHQQAEMSDEQRPHDRPTDQHPDQAHPGGSHGP
jgi:hypothetical protein